MSNSFPLVKQLITDLKNEHRSNLKQCVFYNLKRSRIVLYATHRYAPISEKYYFFMLKLKYLGINMKKQAGTSVCANSITSDRPGKFHEELMYRDLDR